MELSTSSAEVSSFIEFCTLVN